MVQIADCGLQIADCRLQLAPLLANRSDKESDDLP